MSMSPSRRAGEEGASGEPPCCDLSAAQRRSLTDLVERLELVRERADEYPMRVLADQLRAEMAGLLGPDGPPLPPGDLCDPTACDAHELDDRISRLVGVATSWLETGVPMPMVPVRRSRVAISRRVEPVDQRVDRLGVEPPPRADPR